MLPIHLYNFPCIFSALFYLSFVLSRGHAMGDMACRAGFWQNWRWVTLWRWHFPTGTQDEDILRIIFQVIHTHTHTNICFIISSTQTDMLWLLRCVFFISYFRLSIYFLRNDLLWISVCRRGGFYDLDLILGPSGVRLQQLDDNGTLYGVFVTLADRRKWNLAKSCHDDESPHEHQRRTCAVRGPGVLVDCCRSRGRCSWSPTSVPTDRIRCWRWGMLNILHHFKAYS